MKNNPLVSVIMSTYNTEKKFLKSLKIFQNKKLKALVMKQMFCNLALNATDNLFL